MIWVSHQSFGWLAETFGGVPRRGGDKDLTMFFKNFNITWSFGLQWNPRLHFFSTFSSFFFSKPAIVDFVNCEQCICVLFMVPQITLFSNFFIKNGSHNTIYTFKNYFATVFSVSVFSFSKNKLNPNTPLIYIAS